MRLCTYQWGFDSPHLHPERVPRVARPYDMLLQAEKIPMVIAQSHTMMNASTIQPMIIHGFNAGTAPGRTGR